MAVVKRIAILGAESSGKTTLAAALAAKFHTVWVPEYGREMWEAQGGTGTEADLLLIAREQIRREDEQAARADTYLFCDTTPLTTLGYSLWLFGRADPALAQLASREYDGIVLCRQDFPFAQDGMREGPEFSTRQHAWYEDQLDHVSCLVLEVDGDLATRVEQVARWLGAVRLAD